MNEDSGTDESETVDLTEELAEEVEREVGAGNVHSSTSGREGHCLVQRV